jgi:signal peptidase I
MAKAATTSAERARARTKSSIREYVEALVLAIVLTIVIRGLVIQAFRIPTGSMEDTLLVGDFLFVNKMVYGSEIDIGFSGNRLFYYRFPAIRHPKVGDIIVFRYPDDPARDFIKRCVAVGSGTRCSTWTAIRARSRTRCTRIRGCFRAR